MNKVILSGNLSKDIEIIHTASGAIVGKTAIATNKRFTDNQGNIKEEVMFIDLTFFGKTAENVNKYCKKGNKVLIEGSLDLQAWTAQDGTKRSKHAVRVSSVEFLSLKAS